MNASDDVKVQNDFEERRDSYRRREKFILCDLIGGIADKDFSYKILDGGARSGFDTMRWRCLGEARLSLHGFEVDSAECEMLNATAKAAGLDFRFYPVGLWREDGTVDFHLNKEPSGGSLYLQNTELTNRWRYAGVEGSWLARDTYFPVGVCQVPVTSVHNWACENHISKIDYVKLNIEGGELEVLRGFGPLIDSVVGMQIEVSFVESYKNRPLFSDVDKYMRENGFQVFDIIGHHFVGRATSPVIVRHRPGLYPQWGQLIEGHGVYMRDPVARPGDFLENGLLDVDKLLKLAAFSEMYYQIEYAYELLDWGIRRLLTENRPQDAAVLQRLVADGVAWVDACMNDD